MKKFLAALLVMVVVTSMVCAFAEAGYSFTFLKVDDEDGNEVAEMMALYDGATVEIDTEAKTFTIIRTDKTLVETIEGGTTSDDGEYYYFFTTMEDGETRISQVGGMNNSLVLLFKDNESYIWFVADLA